MKLWEKNYLLAFVLFLVVLNVSLFLLLSTAFQVELERERGAAAGEREGISYMIASLHPLENGSVRVAALGVRYREKDVFLRVLDSEGRIVADTLPGKGEEKELFDRRGIVRFGGRVFLCGAGPMTTGSEILEFQYAKDISAVYQNQRKRLAAASAAELCLSALVGTILYMTMKKIYRPVENIAHELRTPLTAIQGYAQYLMAGKLEEEDRFFAGSQIYEESQNLKDIVNKLLIMGNLRSGSVSREWIKAERLFSSVEERYPGLELQSDLEYISGDETLLRSLLLNLTSNAVRAGGPVSITAQGPAITVRNGGESLSEETLRRLSCDRPLPNAQICGNGHGVSLCHEIVKLHQGRLRYEAAEGGGTAAVVTLPEERVQIGNPRFPSAVAKDAT